jgi:hypothetical protein
MISRSALALAVALLLASATASCSREAADAPPAEPEAVQDTVAPDSAEGQVFERSIVFLTPRQDSLLIVPWLLSARTLSGGVSREVRALLSRADTWEAFLTDEWETPSTRMPWRVLPHGQMRLIVSDGDRLQEIVFDEGLRQLEVALGEPRAEWSGQRGETVRLLDGSLVLAGTRVPGVVMDLTRGGTAREGAGGDWAVLVDGDSLRLVLHAAQLLPPGAAGAFRSWALLGAAEMEWPSVTVTWTETRAFERARRDVPVQWSASSAAGDMMVELTVRTAEIQAGEGEGPQLPVDALFDVEGTVRIGEDVYPVRGLLRHTQP